LKHLNRPEVTHQLRLLRWRVDPEHGEAKCYLSGPMTGLPFFNAYAFATAAAVLRDAGWFVFNPLENDAANGLDLYEHEHGNVSELPEFDYKAAMAKDLHQVCSSDAVIVMPGWEYSEGALLEAEVAHRVGVPVYTYLHQRHVEAPVRAPHEFSSRARHDGEASRGEEETGPHVADPSPTPDILDCGPKVLFTDPETGGQKEESQSRFDLIPPDALTALARVYGMGAKKYSPNNYLRGYPWHLSIAALERHVQKFKAGEDIDPESDLPHLAHAAWQAFTLLVFYLRGLGTDDRLKIGAEA
jgi:hypothetical protein